MPSRFDRAVAVTEDSIPLAAIPVVATLLSGSQVARALSAQGGGGVTFPFPSGLPTLWTYVSLPSGPGGIGTGIGGPLSLAAFVPLSLVGLTVTSGLEAGFLGALDSRIDGGPLAVADGVRQFTLRLVAVNLLRIATVLVAVPFFIIPPAAVVVVTVVQYLVYGLPFEIVVRDADVSTALRATVERAKRGDEYARFGGVHLVAGAVASLFLSAAVRNLGLVGIALGTALVAVPAVLVAAYGLLLFRTFDARPRAAAGETPRSPPADGTSGAGATDRNGSAVETDVDRSERDARRDRDG